MPLHVPRIVCRACVVAIDLPENPSSSDQIRCPRCDQSDTLGNAVDQARRHATHMAERALEAKLQRSGRPVSRRTPTVFPERSLRWISNHAG